MEKDLFELKIKNSEVIKRKDRPIEISITEKY